MTDAATPVPYVATPVVTAEGLVDVRVERLGRVWSLAGRGGPAAEGERVRAALAGAPDGVWPVLLGAGLGAGLGAALEATGAPVFVCDREAAIAAATGTRSSREGEPRLRFCDDPDPDRAAQAVIDAARAAGFARLAVVVHPLYPRLDPDWYARVAARLAAYGAARDRLRAPRFAGSGPPRVLLLRRPYFLYREIEAALTRLSVPWRRVETGGGKRGETDVVAAILAAVAAFRPDFALTVNHLGLDREGRLAGLFNAIGLPLASWFVDSPRLILHDHAGLATPLTMLFSYDADALPELAAMGYPRTAWLPLATDPELFRPGVVPAGGAAWRSAVSFVGVSMERQAAEARARLPAGSALARLLPEAAAAFAASPTRGARAFFAADPALGRALDALPGAQARLDAELALTWEATRRSRQARVRALAPLDPTIVGDPGWETALTGVQGRWRRLAPLDYYTELPGFYGACQVNFNCTSLQMKGAVNQRVFDVPACGAFVLTDAREQLDALFDPGRETVTYRAVEEIADLARHYLARPEARRRVTQAARERILAEHTYDHRLRALCAAMAEAFGG